MANLIKFKEGANPPTLDNLGEAGTFYIDGSEKKIYYTTYGSNEEGNTSNSQLIEFTGATQIPAKTGTGKKSLILNDLENNIASGDYSHVEGLGTTALGAASHVEGLKTTAYGEASHAEGGSSKQSIEYITDIKEATVEDIQQEWTDNDKDSQGKSIGFSLAYGINSHVEGRDCLAIGSNSHAEGIRTQTSGNDSHAEGNNTRAYANYSHAEGLNTITGDSTNLLAGQAAHAEGLNTVAYGEASHASGCKVRTNGSYSFATGCAEELSTPIQPSDIQYTYIVHSFRGSSDDSLGVWSFYDAQNRVPKIGQVFYVKGKYSTPYGTTNDFLEKYLVINVAQSYEYDGTKYFWKIRCISMGSTSFALGQGFTPSEMQGGEGENLWGVSQGSCSFIEGKNNMAVNHYTHAAGIGNMACFPCQFICGSYGKNDLPQSLFIIGNGKDTNNRSNAFEVDALGNGYFQKGCYAKGLKLTGADYAEYFKWENTPNEKPQSLFVTLDKDKIRLASKEDDYILGIISTNPGVVGNNSIDENRENDPEYAIVGLMGQIIVEDDGTCEPNKYCYPSEKGVATASETGYRVMKRIDDNHILVMFR